MKHISQYRYHCYTFKVQKINKLSVQSQLQTQSIKSLRRKKNLLQFLNQLTFNCRVRQIVTSFSVRVSQGKINQKKINWKCDFNRNRATSVKCEPACMTVKKFKTFFFVISLDNFFLSPFDKKKNYLHSK